MVNIQRIDDKNLEFPATEQALSYPNGLLAVGGDLSADRLINAYQQGIFPWYEDPQPIMWWSPNPRSVLFPVELRVSRSLRKRMRNSNFRVRADTAFHRVVSSCAAPRSRETGTWITNAMGRAYMDLHRRGYAHSIEVWDSGGELVGGLYGVTMGAVFFGESMFCRKSDASKMALVATAQLLLAKGYQVIDCQVESDHLNSLGARNIPRHEFERYLPPPIYVEPPAPWILDSAMGDYQ
jgi:leucyl/phenylalanyl-tRNA--protein transferase